MPGVASPSNDRKVEVIDSIRLIEGKGFASLLGAEIRCILSSFQQELEAAAPMAYAYAAPNRLDILPMSLSTR